MVSMLSFPDVMVWMEEEYAAPMVVHLYNNHTYSPNVYS